MFSLIPRRTFYESVFPYRWVTAIFAGLALIVLGILAFSPFNALTVLFGLTVVLGSAHLCLYASMYFAIAGIVLRQPPLSRRLERSARVMLLFGRLTLVSWVLLYLLAMINVVLFVALLSMTGDHKHTIVSLGWGAVGLCWLLPFVLCIPASLFCLIESFFSRTFSFGFSLASVFMAANACCLFQIAGIWMSSV